MCEVIELFTRNVLAQSEPLIWTCEDYDVECDTPDEALEAFHNDLVETFWEEYDPKQSRYYLGHCPTTIIGLDDGEPVIRLDAWADIEGFGFYKQKERV